MGERRSMMMKMSEDIQPNLGGPLSTCEHWGRGGLKATQLLIPACLSQEET